MTYIILLLTAFFFSTNAWAGEWTVEDCKNIAIQQFHTDNISVAKDTDCYCIIQRDDTTGYIIVSKSTNTKHRIVGYSNTSRWREREMPEQLLSWLDSLRKTDYAQIKIFNKEEGINTLEIKPSIPPLLTCHWHQNSPYNDLAPVIADGNVKCVAGCVAIAAAQITYYWREYNPKNTLMDTPTYPYGKAPVTFSLPQGTPNNWDLILDSYNNNSSIESRAAVAQLCYVIGTTSYLNYASSTGGSIIDASNAIYSQYNISSTYAHRRELTQAEWENILYTDLQKGYPVMCAGSSTSGAHAFVLDGYDNQLDLYHFNFGWGGNGDGYYMVDGSYEAMGGYYLNQSIVYDIHPDSYISSINNPFADYYTNMSTESSSDDYQIYDISGKKLTELPAHGMFIIREKGKVKKRIK